MDNQEWIAVPSRRRSAKKSASELEVKPNKQEKEDVILPKMKLNSECLQQLIRKRIQMKVNQEKADTICAFPKSTFKNIESNRILPNDAQRNRIAKVFDVALKIDSVL
jgi:hypothetical protein